jgi:hypothetical protein
MDSLITAAARALASGDPLSALKRIALREDAPALALRGIAMAQLGDLAKAKALLRRAARAFGSHEAVSRARCVVAEAEIALVSRDLSWPAKALEMARITLERHVDTLNAAHARHLEVRRFLLIGQVENAERALSGLNPAAFPPAFRTAHELVVAGIAMRRLKANIARSALQRAERAAHVAAVPALMAEVETARRLLDTPAARLIERGEQRPLLLEQVEALVASQSLIVDACRNALRHRGVVIPLARRHVLFALLRALAEVWPADLPRDVLIARVFRVRRADESYRARLRVEMGRLRTLLKHVADVSATPRGYGLVPLHAREVVVLVQPVEDKHAAVLACLADGESWSTSALALALGASQRSMQRALDALAASGRARCFGRARARRWVAAPIPGFTTTLLLPSVLPSG